MDNGINRAIMETFSQGEKDRAAMMQENWEVYYGRGKKPLIVERGGTDDNAMLNYGKAIVDKGVAFLFGKGIKFEITEGEQTPEETWLDDCWTANRKMSLLQKLALAGGVCGTAFIRIHYTPDMVYPKLILVNPETVSIVSADDDVDEVIKYIETYPLVKEVDGIRKSISIRRIYERTENSLYWNVTEQRSESGGRFVMVDSFLWAYDFPPIVHCQNLAQPFEVWGEPDLNESLKNAIENNDFIWSNTRKILRHHAHPKTVAYGIRADSMVETGVDKMLVVESPATEAKIENLEMQSDLASSLEFSRRQVEFIHELSRVPEVASGKVESVGQLSGIALEILYQPLLEKTEAKRVTYGDMIIELNRRLLAIGGFGNDIQTKLVWQELLPKDQQVIANAALVKNQLGISKETLIRELGNYNPDDEKIRWQNEQKDLGGQLLKEFDSGGAEIED